MRGRRETQAKIEVESCPSRSPRQGPKRAARYQSAPSASVVGQVKVLTQIVPVPLEGPAYFVSHGGEAFPDLTMVLKGYGVTVHLVGSTQIKNGVTTSTFKATPDVPFTSFELSLSPVPELSAHGKRGPVQLKASDADRIHGAERGAAKARREAPRPQAQADQKAGALVEPLRPLRRHD